MAKGNTNQSKILLNVDRFREQYRQVTRQIRRLVSLISQRKNEREKETAGCQIDRWVIK